ncbi:PREDICTED: uncharacterized protein At5g65660-like [Fragaria vesca subsp. vesca]|uniref:uncharacterized protein At5g65660-like n=1 Tax=Fragaria vesca subsp. vesca TaxID=101020 RepID=UPI0002C36E8A|nr:PREDICTED: uncharacterized protein At5g65660-like [Fragaria vesca subsp. vesca]
MERRMENDEISTRPSLAFPLGLALVLLMLLSICAFFLCCIYWDRLRSLFVSSLDQEHDLEAESDQKPARPKTMENQDHLQSLPVLMPGDQVPKFIAIACPCELPAVEKKITVIVDKPTRDRLCDASTVYS